MCSVISLIFRLGMERTILTMKLMFPSFRGVSLRYCSTHVTRLRAGNLWGLPRVLPLLSKYRTVSFVMAPNECWEHECIDIFGVSVQQVIDPEAQAQLGMGAIVWDTAILTGLFFSSIGSQDSTNNFLQGKTVLELGSGTGALGLVVASLGAQHVRLTDRANVLHLTRRNIEGNRHLQGRVSVERLEWEKAQPSSFELCKSESRSFQVNLANAAAHGQRKIADILLCSDLMYEEPEGHLGHQNIEVTESLSDCVPRKAFPGLLHAILTYFDASAKCRKDGTTGLIVIALELRGPQALSSIRSFFCDILMHRSAILPREDGDGACRFYVEPKVYVVRHPVFLNSKCRLVLISGAECTEENRKEEQTPENVREVQLLSHDVSIDEMRVENIRCFS